MIEQTKTPRPFKRTPDLEYDTSDPLKTGIIKPKSLADYQEALRWNEMVLASQQRIGKSHFASEIIELPEADRTAVITLLNNPQKARELAQKLVEESRK